MKRTTPITAQNSGFTLVELSIVLTILALLVGGILAGRSLMRTMELRGAMDEHQQWQTALNTFQMQYYALPGDMMDATRYWGDAGVCGSVLAESHTDVLEGTCNGNGNGIVFSTLDDRYERYLFWQHLQLAGLIPGDYSGVRGNLSVSHHIPGINSPRSKLKGAGWRAVYRETPLDGNDFFHHDYANALALSGVNSSGMDLLNVLSPKEAWQIDHKFDDGKPASGAILVARNNNLCTDATGKADYNAAYRLNEKSIACALFFRPGS